MNYNYLAQGKLNKAGQIAFMFALVNPWKYHLRDIWRYAPEYVKRFPCHHLH